MARAGPALGQLTVRQMRREAQALVSARFGCATHREVVTSNYRARRGSLLRSGRMRVWTDAVLVLLADALYVSALMLGAIFGLTGADRRELWSGHTFSTARTRFASIRSSPRSLPTIRDSLPGVERSLRAE